MERLSKETIQELMRASIKLARSDRADLVPILGAGTSLPLGLPNWDQLIQSLNRRAHINLQTPVALPPPDILTEVRQHMGTTEFIARIQNNLELDTSSTTLTLQALVAAPLKHIVTTNLDFAVEIAFSKGGKPLPPENVGRGYSMEELSLFDRNSERPILMKIHGSLERPSTWVLTREDYDTAYIVPGNLRDFFTHKVRIPLFIGFSFSDFDVNESLRLAQLTWKKKAYSILPLDEAAKRRFDLRRLGVIPIGFDSFDQLPEIIDEIFQCTPLNVEFCRFKTGDPPRIKVGAADIKVPLNVWSSEERKETLTNLLSNAFEPQPNVSMLDERARRVHGQKGLYRESARKMLRERDADILNLAFRAIAQYPDVLFEGLTSWILERTDILQYRFLRSYFDAVADERNGSGPRMEGYLLRNIHNPKFGYQCLRSIAKLLALRGLHPAMKLPPPSVRIDRLKLVAAVYPLTRHQVGLLTGAFSLKTQPSVWPYTLERREESRLIIDLLQGTTDQSWRLPTSEEWLAIAGIHNGCPWPWGTNFPEFKRHAHLRYVGQGGYVAQHALEVGIFPAGQSPHGLLDLIGNVYEVVTLPSPAGYALAGGAWTTGFNERTPERFQAIFPWGKGHGNVGIRPVRDIT